MTVELIKIADEYPAPGWKVNRSVYPVRYTVVHHSAGWYTRALTPSSNEAAERDEIAALAVDHQSRFGIGPGYHIIVAPSERVYILDLWTHRAHTKGRGPGLIQHNMQGIGICALGDYESTSRYVPNIVRGILAAQEYVEDEMAHGAILPRFYHGTIPTVNSANIQYSQATLCPGRNLVNALVNLTVPKLEPAIPDLSPTDAYLATMDRGYGQLGRRVVKQPPTDNDWVYTITVPKKG